MVQYFAKLQPGCSLLLLFIKQIVYFFVTPPPIQHQDRDRIVEEKHGRAAGLQDGRADAAGGSTNEQTKQEDGGQPATAAAADLIADVGADKKTGQPRSNVDEAGVNTDQSRERPLQAANVA